MSTEAELVEFSINSICENIPNRDTKMSLKHKIVILDECGNTQFLQASDVKRDGVKNISYTGSFLYNIVLEKHSVMMVNNMIVETLDPTTPVAQYFVNKTSSLKNTNTLLFQTLKLGGK